MPTYVFCSATTPKEAPYVTVGKGVMNFALSREVRWALLSTVRFWRSWSALNRRSSAFWQSRAVLYLLRE